MIYKWWNYFGLSLGLYRLEWFLCYDHMSVKKLDSNVKTIGIFETVKEKRKFKIFSAVLFLFRQLNILQLSKITNQNFITNISAWTCKTSVMHACHRQGHFVSWPAYPFRSNNYGLKEQEDALSPSLKVSPLPWSPSMKLNSDFFLSLRQTTPHQNNLYFEQQHDTVPFWSGSLIHHPKRYPKKRLNGYWYPKG